jgi:hypothetical protein
VESKSYWQGYVWIRTLKRAPDNSPLQIMVNKQMEIASSAVVHDLNQWIWEPVKSNIVLIEIKP